MRAAVFRKTGAARDVLSVEEVEAPQPGPGEVRVRITRSGVNPTDWKERAHGPGIGDLPFKVPNQDGAGVVESVGPGVDPARVGERVWIWLAAWQRQWGTAAELCVVPAELAVGVRGEASDDLLASIGIPAITAHRCLFADGPIDGMTVLVSGGAGAVGHSAIELARRRGARVIATVSSDEKAALARDGGAHEVVNYREEDAAARIRALAPDGVDRVAEVALHDNVALDAAVCAPNAVIGSYAAAGPVHLDVVRAFMTANVTLRFILLYTMPLEAQRAAVADVSAALAEGVLTELPAHHFPLDAIADAHDAVEAGAIGKVLVDVA